MLTGDGNMHWEAALSEDKTVKAFHVWHEHCTVATASAYAVASGKVGVASVTCGPGVTQLMTGLATAANTRIPLVVFAGESPIHAGWYNQEIGQGPLVEATGAHYIAAHSLRRMFEYVSEAFYIAKTERRPVVLGIPIDLQQVQIPSDFKYVPSDDLIPDTGPVVPHPNYVNRAVEGIAQAERIIIIAGRGAQLSDAKALCEQLAERCNGLLATTLPVRGLFEGVDVPSASPGVFASSHARSLCPMRSGGNCGCQSDPPYHRRRQAFSAGCGRANRSEPARREAWSANCAHLSASGRHRGAVCNHQGSGERAFTWTRGGVGRDPYCRPDQDGTL